jgi:hypothetical protein
MIGEIKDYLLVRWRHRWPIVPASFLLAFLWATEDYWAHHGPPQSIVLTTLCLEERTQRILLFTLCFDLVVVLFPFQWGGEDLNDPDSVP